MVKTLFIVIALLFVSVSGLAWFSDPGMQPGMGLVTGGGSGGSFASGIEYDGAWSVYTDTWSAYTSTWTTAPVYALIGSDLIPIKGSDGEYIIQYH